MKKLLLLLQLLFLQAFAKNERPQEETLRDNYEVLSIDAQFFMEDSFLIEKLCKVLLVQQLNITVASTKMIQFHVASNIEVTAKDIIIKDNPVTNFVYNKEAQILNVFFKNPAKKGDKLVVTIGYRIRFNNNLGFNMLAEKDLRKKEYMLISDNFPHARGMFVGKDTRSSKSNVKLTVIVPPEFEVSTSLGFIEKCEPKAKELQDLMAHTFESSKKISLSEVTIAIHRMEKVQYECGEESKITVFGNKRVLKSPEIAVDAACHACELAKNEWGFDCFKNSDEIQLISIPESIGLRHNTLGLIPLAEDWMVYNETMHIKKVGFKVARNVMQATLRAILTNNYYPKGYEDDWVIYGYAGYFTHKSLPFDGFNAFEKLAFDLIKVKEYEIKPNTIALSEKIHERSDIHRRHDTVAYPKTTSLFLMMEKYYGDNFYKLLNAFLKKYCEKVFTSDDFLKFISEKKGDGKKRFGSFLTREGVHIVKHNDNIDTLQFSQIRATRLQPKKNNNQIDLIVSFSMQNNNKPTNTAILDKTVSKNLIKMSTKGAVPILNPEATGYYIAEYSKPEITYILSKRFKTFPMVLQTSFLGDIWTRLKLNLISFKDGYTSFVESLKIGKPQTLLFAERVYFDLLPYIEKSKREIFNKRFWADVKPAFDKIMELNPKGEGGQQEETWSSLWTLAIMTGEASSTEIAEDCFQNWKTCRNTIPAKQKAGTYCYGFKNPKYYKKMLDEMRSFVDAQDKRLIYTSVRCMEDPERFDSLLTETHNSPEEYNRELLHLPLEQGYSYHWNTTWTFVKLSDPKSLQESNLNSPPKKEIIFQLAQNVRKREEINEIGEWLNIESNQDNLGVDINYIEEVKSTAIFTLHNNLELSTQINAYFFNIKSCSLQRLRSHVETSCALNQALRVDRVDGTHDPLGNEDYCEEDGVTPRKPKCMIMFKKTSKTTCEFYKERKRKQEKLKTNFTVIANPGVTGYKSKTISRTIEVV